MNHRLFNPSDLEQMDRRGITSEQLERQIKIFETGVAYAPLVRPSRIGDGIQQFDAARQAELLALFESARNAGRVTKFVPASGAASRMFKTLHGTLAQLKAGDPSGDQAAAPLMESLQKFPFFEELKNRLRQRGLEIEALCRGNQPQPILETILGEDQMNFGQMPKGLLPFHRHREGIRTAMEEHFVEALAYGLDQRGRARLHFTVSPEHLDGFKDFVAAKRPLYQRNKVEMDISFSLQKASTDTLAVDLNNQPFRREDGGMVFRPGGHGALIENLNDLKGDILFIKNIDNVVKQSLQADTIHYKMVLAGHLIWLQDQVFEFLRLLSSKPTGSLDLSQMERFINQHLGWSCPPTTDKTPDDRRQIIMEQLNRPIRVCGMVESTGEPGGGPFWIQSRGGCQSLQIVETSQIDSDNPQQASILRSATHFNPVDLVCGVRDFEGAPFDLRQYVDPSTCFYFREIHARQTAQSA